MIEALPVSVVLQGGAFGVLLLMLVWLFRSKGNGQLISWREHERAVAAAERRESEWRQAYLTEVERGRVEQERGRVRDDQIEELMEMSRTQAQIWQAVQDMARPSGQS